MESMLRLTASRKQLQVMVVDENPLTRFAMLSVANLHPLLRVSGEASCARSAREIYPRECPQIVVLDIVLPHGDGIELLRHFSRLRPSCLNVVLSGICDSAVVRRAFDAGAKAYVSKRDETAELLCALEAVITGGTYLGKIVSQTLQSELRHKLPSPALKALHALSDREMHVFRLFGDGQGVTAIARDLSVSVKTIETHQSRIKKN